jgi:hypothetical protein
MKNILWSVLLLTGLMTGCATVPTDDIRVEAEADPKVSFSGYKTYAWLLTIDMLNDPEGAWKPPAFDANAEIVYLINERLRARGMSETSDNPDMLVAFAAGADMDALKLKKNPDTSITTLENVPQAGLVVVLIDPQTEFVAWAGVATGEIRKLDEASSKKRLEYAVKNMFRLLPE